MAHEIEMTTGGAAMFAAGEAPWHKLGVNVSEAQTSADAIQLARLDWTVEQWTIQAHGPAGETQAVGDKVANVRGDTNAVLGVVGIGYRPFQNADCFDFMDNIVGEKLAMFETAGALKGGRRVWMLARIPKELRIAGDDVVKPYVLVTNGHDGATALRMIPTTVRVVCNNTLNLALGKAKAMDGLTIYHTESLDRRVAAARKNLGVILERVDEFERQAQVMAKKTLSAEQLAFYFAGLVEGRAEKGQKKLLEALYEHYESPKQRISGIQGTAWSAFNAVSDWADHDMIVFGQTTAARLDNRLNSVWFGAADRIKQAAFETALAMAS